MNGVLVDKTTLKGIAFLKLEAANMGENTGDLVCFTPGDDPLIYGYSTYNQVFGQWEDGYNVKKRPIPIDNTNSDIPPVCKKKCKWRRKYNNFSLQSNALRVEAASMVATWRCGWNLKSNRIGGHPLDYAPCTFNKE
jgi:hypothetical protein